MLRHWSAGLVLSFTVDKLECGVKGMKMIVLGLNTVSTIGFTLFALACSGGDQLPAMLTSKLLIYTTCILGGLTINGTIPLYYELCVEASYPIAEGLTAGSLITINNLGCAIFLVVPSFVSGTSWMNWAMVVAAATAVPLIIPFPVSSKRTQVDIIGDASVVDEILRDDDPIKYDINR